MPTRFVTFGQTRLYVRGEPAPLPPRTLQVLLRLALAAGEALPVERIFRDVWNQPGAPVGRGQRNQVQKCINLLRTATGVDGEPFIRTDDGPSTSGYRLALSRELIDFLHFESLLEQARSADVVSATDMLESAFDLWQGAPLADVARMPFARQPIRRLLEIRTQAERDLIALYQQMGKLDKASTFGANCLKERPDDSGLRTTLNEVNERLRSRRRGLIQHTFRHGMPVDVVVAPGDIFDHDDAHLVVGFSDTFDTDIRDNVVISQDSLQAQAMRRLFGNDRDLLDRRLRTALRGAPKAGREQRAAKPRGRLIRYPIGTVAVLRQSGRCVFALAYSRMGNDLVARSTLNDLRTSLDQLWQAVYQQGQLRPVATPIIGAGLARLDASPTPLLTMILDSFGAETRRRPVTRELRILVSPTVLADLDLEEAAEFLHRL